MSVKFKIGFTIDAETLFGILAKMLPIEDLSVEELAPAERAIRIANAPPRKLPRPKRASNGPNLKAGINGIILSALTQKPQRASELQPLLKRAGFSVNSISSRLQALERFNILVHDDEGVWRLKESA
jgi:hypothetical protein